MARYSPEMMERILADDEVDVLAVQFIAKATMTVSKASALVHSNQQESINTFVALPAIMDTANLTPGDKIRIAIEDCAKTTLEAQASMQSSLSLMTESMAKVVNRSM